MKTFYFLASAAAVLASPCPYGDFAERAALPAGDAAKFFAARALGETAVEVQTKQKREAEHAAQAEFYKRQVEARQLTLGGGLL
jgi:hypothetical protein